MNAEQPLAMSERDRTLQRRFRRLGVGLLVAGLLAAVLIYRRAAPEEESADAFLAGTSKRYLYEMERIGGKSNLVATELRDWFGSQWHGRKLARTVAVLSIGGALACFGAAQLLSHPLPPDDGIDEKVA
jgi:hypothetical protein